MAKTANKTESGILGMVHKTAAGLHRAGLVDKATMREFDALCLTAIRPDQAQRKLPAERNE
jgi:putative transcriptional regulator